MEQTKIKVGDLVVIIRGCTQCGDTGAVGKIFKVEGLSNINLFHVCCHKRQSGVTSAISGETVTYSGIQLPIHYDVLTLKKIPPLEDDEKITWEEELTV